MTITNMSRCVEREENLLKHNDCTFTNFVPRPTEGENTSHKNTSDPWMGNRAVPSHLNQPSELHSYTDLLMKSWHMNCCFLKGLHVSHAISSPFKNLKPFSINWILNCLKHMAVSKRKGPRISPGYWERGPRLLSWENRRKIEPKEIAGCLTPHLLTVFTQQLEILLFKTIIILEIDSPHCHL